MATSYVNKTLNEIHNLIQTSGLHYVINSTPFSSYITIRKKLQNDEQIPHKDAATSLAVTQRNNLADIKEKLATIKSRNASLEEALVRAEEDAKEVEAENSEKVSRLHFKLDSIESSQHSLEKELAAKDFTIEALGKEIKVKEEIINNINRGFNQKVEELKDKLECLEKEKKDAIRKEKKVKKKKYQKARKEEQKHESKRDELKENNNLKEEPELVKMSTYPCPFCDFVAKNESAVEEHALENHEQFAKIQRKFDEQNSESIRMLGGLSRCDWVLTPEEITHLGVDWKTHLEILEILNQ